MYAVPETYTLISYKHILLISRCQRMNDPGIMLFNGNCFLSQIKSEISVDKTSMQKHVVTAI